MAMLSDDRKTAVEASLRALFGSIAFELGPGYVPHREAAPDLPEDSLPGAARLTALLDGGAAHLERARAAHADLARAAAAQATALAAFARHRPVALDRPDGEVGAAAAQTRAARPAALTTVSEWAVDEVAVALQLTGPAAAQLLNESVLLDERLPATLAALHEGRSSWRHAQVLADLVAPLRDEVREVAEERLLARADGRTHTQLRAAARRVVQRLDADALAERVRQAVRDRRITVHPGDDGMATLSAVLPAPVARAVQDALRQYAEVAVVEGDERTPSQRMVDCLVDLVLRPGEHGMSPVQARLTIVAAVETLLGSDEPGEVDGDLLPAAMVRELAVALGLLPEPGPAAGPADDAPGSAEAKGEQIGDVAGDPVADGPVPADQRHGTAGSAAEWSVDGLAAPDRGGSTPADDLAAVLGVRRLAGTALARRPHIALVDGLTGQLLALSHATELRSGRGVGPPPASPGYRPGDRLDRFVRQRDRRCRFPGCRARPTRTDLDHTVPWPAGPTDASNLACLCRHHHRLRHQAPGWRLRGVADGGLEWTTPGGRTVTTHPPRFGTDDSPPERGVHGAAAEGPGPSTPPDGGPDDPPPF